MTPHCVHILALSCLAGLLTASAPGESGEAPSPGDDRDYPSERDAAAFDDVLGEVRLVVFGSDPPRPLSDVTLRVGPVVLGRTNEDGVLTVELFGGLYHVTFEFTEDDARTEAIRVRPEETVEVLVEAPPGATTLQLRLEQSSSQVAGAHPSGTDLRGASLSVIEGEVIQQETGRPVPEARIFVRGLPVEVLTDVRGRFRVEVPSGIHDVVMVHPGFDTVTTSGIEVPVDHPAAVVIEAASGGVELEEMTVTEPRIEGSAVDILAERKETTQVSEVIGAEQISKSGDSNAAAALKRITGVTIVGGKFVYVRGLGERYSSTTLNGLNLPSPDPERRVVPLDMFPAEILDSMRIQKTFSPEMPGEFGGGSVNLRTRGYPNELLLKVEVAGGVNTGGTFSRANVTEDSAPTDVLGIDGGYRDLPPIVKDATADQPLVAESLVSDGYSAEELSKFTKAMPRDWGIDNKRIPPNLKLAATAGNGWRLNKAKLGFLASALYKNDWDVAEVDRREYALDAGNLSLQNQYLTDDTLNIINLGGMLTMGVTVSDSQTLLLNTIVDRITDDDFYSYEAYHSDFDARVYHYEWIERMIFSQQVIGHHIIEKAWDLDVNWRYAYSMAGRKEPDKRFVRYDYEDIERTVLAVSTETNANRRDYLTVDDRTHDIGLDLALPFSQWTRENGKVTTGGGITLRSREADTRRFAYGRLNNVAPEARHDPPWDFFVNANEGPDGMRLIEVTESTDNYTGEQEVFAYYLSADLPLGLGFTASGGIRLENSHQRVATFDIFGDGTNEVVRTIHTLDLLPALVLTYEIRKDMLIRLGYGKTLNRPDFREMSPGCATAYAGARRICGAPEEIANPEYTPDSPPGVPATIPYTLQRAVIHNVDARWEWYFTPYEIVSFGAFYKKFIDPIELVLRAGSEKIAVLLNAEGAHNVGVELEVKKNFGFVTEALSDLFIASNAAWIYSQIEIPESTLIIQTNSKRPLEGQSPFVVNAQLGYDNADIGLSAILLYNVFGKRIVAVGSSDLPDIYEQPFHQLDLVVKKDLKKGFQFGVKAINLIDLPARETQGNRVTETYRKGREVIVSLSWTY